MKKKIMILSIHWMVKMLSTCNLGLLINLWMVKIFLNANNRVICVSL